jgi:hypothetical protein
VFFVKGAHQGGESLKNGDVGRRILFFVCKSLLRNDLRFKRNARARFGTGHASLTLRHACLTVSGTPRQGSEEGSSPF